MKRYFGFDVHKNFIMAAAVDGEQNIVMQPRKISAANFDQWVAKNLTQEDEAIIEAMTGSWITYDLLVRYVGRVVVSHPYHVKLIASSFVKTDKRDAIALARLLAAKIAPEVWVPPPHVRELRSLVYHRQRLVSRRATAKNRVRGVLQIHRIIGPKGMSAFDLAYWESLDVPLTDKLRAQHAIAEIQMLTCQIKEVEEEMTRLSASEYWVADMPYLLQLPGIGLITAMTILSAIGEIERFPSAKKLVGYAGLGARVHSSGLTHNTGGITKQGRRELRTAMIEAAWNAIKYSPYWKARFEGLVQRMGRQKATVAIARKLLVVIWNVLSHRTADQNANHNAVAKSMMLWGRRNRLAISLGMKPVEFTRQKLNQLGLGLTLEKVTYTARSYPLPPPSKLAGQKESQPH